VLKAGPRASEPCRIPSGPRGSSGRRSARCAADRLARACYLSNAWAPLSKVGARPIDTILE